MTISLVVGNMIGSGIFLLPASLAVYGVISIGGWILSTLGAITIAMTFSYLNKHLPNAKGGPYAYSKHAFGDYVGFTVAWGYWNSIWCTNAAITVALVSYLSIFFPVLAANNVFALLLGIGFILLLSWVNTRPVRNSGYVQLITTILKIIPLLIVGIVGLFYIEIDNFQLPDLNTKDSFGAITATTTLTLFAFLGIESATIPQNHIINPERTVRIATIWGTIITALIYILGSIAVMGIIHPDQLQQSDAPFAEAAQVIGGNSLKYFVGIGAVIATFGALNGWILIQGQIPMAAAEDGLFPKIFKKTNRFGAPARGIFLSSILAIGLLIMNYNKSTIHAFTFMLLLGTLNVLVPYLFSSAGNFLLATTKKMSRVEKLTSLVAFVFSTWMVIGCGAEVVYYGFLLLIFGIPFYIWMKQGK